MIAQAVISGRFMIHTATKPLEATVILVYASSLFVNPVLCVGALFYIYILLWKSRVIKLDANVLHRLCFGLPYSKNETRLALIYESLYIKLILHS